MELVVVNPGRPGRRVFRHRRPLHSILKPRRSNPPEPKGIPMRLRRRRLRRRNPSKGASTIKSHDALRRRRNPSKGASTIKSYNALRRRAASAGVSAKGSMAQIRARLSAKKSLKRKKRRAAQKNPARPARRRRSEPGRASKADIAAVASLASDMGTKRRGGKSSGKGKKISKRRGRRSTKASALRKARRSRRITGAYSRSARITLRKSKDRQRRGIARWV